MSSEMVERVARALAAHSWELGGNDHSIGPFVDRRWPHYVGQARAAIEAMRIPTEAMIEDAESVEVDTNYVSGVGYMAIGVEEIYQTMIDAALKDTP